MRHLLATIALGLLACTQATAATQAEIADFAKSIERPLAKARYMEGKCQSVAVPGWEGLPTQQCSYTMTDKKTGERKSGLVVMLNPSAQKLAEWIMNACEQVAPKQNKKTCTTRLFARVLDQSGGQFPVAGVVYEDLIPEDGVNEAYAFRDGVTVLEEGVVHRGTAALSEAELSAALTGAVRKTASANAPARVVGVTRSEFKRYRNAANVDGLAWLDVVRLEHQAAMKGDRNALVEARLAAHPK